MFCPWIKKKKTTKNKGQKAQQIYINLTSKQSWRTLMFKTCSSNCVCMWWIPMLDSSTCGNADLHDHHRNSNYNPFLLVHSLHATYHLYFICYTYQFIQKISPKENIYEESLLNTKPEKETTEGYLDTSRR